MKMLHSEKQPNKIDLIKGLIILLHIGIGVSVFVGGVSNELGTLQLPVPQGMRWYTLGMERNVCFCTAIALSIILITLLWNGVFYGMRHCKWTCLGIIVASLLLSLFVVPLNYTLEIDNVTLFAYALRGIPDYWNGFYQVPLYMASMIVMHNPTTMVFLQMACFLSVLAYLSARWKECIGGKSYIFIWCVLLFPSAFDLMVNPYRNNINAIIFMYVAGSLFLDIYTKKHRSMKQLVVMGIVLGFLIAYRTENVYLLILYGVLLWSNYCEKKAYVLYGGLVAIGCALVFTIPQRLGEQKYYPKDYKIVNQVNTVQSILSSPNCNLRYESAEQDLLLINDFGELNEIVQGGLEGYRASLFSKNGTLNQSLKSEKEQEEFLIACYRLYMHNMSLYLQERFATFLEGNAFGFRMKGDTEKMQALYLAQNDAFAKNYAEVQREVEGIPLMHSKTRNTLLFYVFMIGKGYSDIMLEINLWAILRIINYGIFIGCIVYLCVRKKEELRWGIPTLMMAMLLMLTVFMFEPEGRMAYFLPASFFMFFVNGVLISKELKNEKNAGQVRENVENM